MTFQASKNPNGDLLVVVDETVCVAASVAELKEKHWQDDLVKRIEVSHCPRMDAPVGPLSEADAKELDRVCKDALKDK